MTFSDRVPPSPLPAVRSQTASRRLGLRSAACLAAVAAVAAGLVVLAGWEPLFYRERSVVQGDVSAAEQAARRLVSDASALRAAVVRPGSWEAVFDEQGFNAWLALDQPRNHPSLLPPGMSDVRVRFATGRANVGVRVGVGPMQSVAWAQVEIRLREPNQLGIVVVDAGLGHLPLPRGWILGDLARRLRRLGLVATVRPLDGRPVLVVYIPSTQDAGGASHWLETLAIGDGFVAVSGRTRPPGDRPDVPAPAAP